jgi:hypothetical protein
MSLEEMKAHPGATPAWNQAKPKLNLTWKKWTPQSWRPVKGG